MRLCLIIIVIVYMTVLEILSMYSEEENNNKFFQWYFGVDQYGHSDSIVTPSVIVTLIFAAVIISLWVFF